MRVGDRVQNFGTVDTLPEADARSTPSCGRSSSRSSTQSRTHVRAVGESGAADTGAFVAGADVTELRERDMLEQREASKRPRVYERVDDSRQPVIARVNGHALGGGCELMQACDVRIAHERSKLGQPEINLGIMPGGGGTQRLPRLVGEGHALRLPHWRLIDARRCRYRPRRRSSR